MNSLANTLKYLPDSPGVYIMKDKNGRILYIGKALQLSKRVRSYFKATGAVNNQDLTEKPIEVISDGSLSIDSYKTKIDNMLSRVTNIDYIVTSTEEEALLLEANLIKKHKPKYNISLKDDKRYPFLKLTLNEPFPRLFVTRSIEKDGSKYFGPYADATTLRKTLRYIEWIFPLRTCKRKIVPIENTKTDKKTSAAKEHKNKTNAKDIPCLNYQLGKCPAPCIGKISRKEYRQIVKNIISFLKGRYREIQESLKKEMQKASESLDFERAAKIRDRIATLERIRSSQTIHFPAGDNRDVIAIYKEENLAAVSVLKILNGKLLNNENRRLNNVEDAGLNEILAAFISQYYADIQDSLPDKIMLSHVPSELDTLNKLLKNRLLIPQRGDNRLLMNIAKKNAFNFIESIKLSHLRKTDRTVFPIRELKEKLNLNKLPRKIICLDVSTIGGIDTVSSIVYFENGKPSKKRYRRFIIKKNAIQDDYAAIEETLTRYLLKVEEEDIPDLIVIDGGKGQLNAACKAMQNIIASFTADTDQTKAQIKQETIKTIPVISLAKKVEQVFMHNRSEPVLLPRSSSALRLLVNIRDEAHRFAITYHRKKRKKRTLASELDSIKGIGDYTKFILLNSFGSVKNIKKATREELIQVKGVGQITADLIIEGLNKDKKESD